VPDAPILVVLLNNLAEDPVTKIKTPPEPFIVQIDNLTHEGQGVARMDLTKRNIMLKKFTLFFVMVLGVLLSTISFALTPPRPGEMQKYLDDGSYTRRVSDAYRLGNHQADPQLVRNMQRRLHELQGVPVPGGLLPAPPLVWQGGLPAFGSPKILVILVDFSDQPHTAAQTTDDVQLKMFGTGNLTDAPYESLRSFYQRSSYGQLSISGNVLGWYRAANPRSYYETVGNTELIKEALDHYNAQGHDFTQYDNDGNGVIDAFFIKWTGPDNGWGNFWWAYQSGIYDPSYTIDGKQLGRFVWSWYSTGGDDVYKPSVDIHETGHLLGLPDYYDYDDTVGPRGGVGGLDMMDSNWGDHNSFSKFMLEWLTPTVVASVSQTKILNPSGSTADAVLIMPGATATTPFAEFFMGQYRKRNVGNDPNDYPTDGLILWHVDARLNDSGDDFRYDNSYTSHKLLRLMEADGLEEIEQNNGVDADDFYLPPKIFDSQSVPNSNNYLGQNTGVIVDNLTTPGITISARFAVGGSACNYQLSPTSQSFSASGGTGSMNVTADSGCAWTAVTSNSWIAITAGSSGSSNGIVSYTVAANTSTDQRTGTLTIGGKTFTVTQVGGSTLPDLVITAVTSPSTGVAGGQIEVSETIKNQGGQATGETGVGFYLSTDSTITASDIPTYYGCGIVTIAPGESQSCGGLIEIPTSVAAGSYYFGAYADDNSLIAESNETNNGLAATNIITITSGVTTYLLTLDKTGSGTGTVTGTGINCGSDCTESYASGSAVSLTAIADAGSTFAGWNPAICGVAFNITSNITCTVIFNRDPVGQVIRQYLGSSPDNIMISGIAGHLVEVLDFGGLDTYTLLPTPAGPVRITDNQASNIILPAGLTISAAQFISTGVQFTVNGHNVTLLGKPAAFTFVFAGSPLDPQAGVPRTLAETAALFGVYQVPVTGQPPAVAPMTGTIQPDGTLDVNN